MPVSPVLKTGNELIWQGKFKIDHLTYLRCHSPRRPAKPSTAEESASIDALSMSQPEAAAMMGVSRPSVQRARGHAWRTPRTRKPRPPLPASGARSDCQLTVEGGRSPKMAGGTFATATEQADGPIPPVRQRSRVTPSCRHESGDTFSSRLTRASHPDRRAAVAPA